MFKDTDGSGDYTLDTEVTTLNPVGAGTLYEFIVTDLTGGDYYIRVEDSEGCSAFSPIVTLPAYDELEDIISDVTTALSCADSATIEGSFTSDLGGVTNATITLYDSDDNPVGLPITGVSVGDTFTFTNLGADAYTIRVEDPVTGCYIEELQEVEAIPVYNVNLIFDDAFVCDVLDFSSLVTIQSITSAQEGTYTGNYTYEVFDISASTTIVVDSATAQNGSSTITGLGAGRYYVEVTMEDYPLGCKYPSNPFVIEIPDTPTISASRTVTDVSCIGSTDGIIDIISVEGGYGCLLYTSDAADE